MKNLIVLLFVISAVALRADEIAITLLTPVVRPAAGAQIAVDLLWLNQGETAQRIQPPAMIDAVLQQGTATWPVRLKASAVAGEVGLERGGFARRSYVLSLPGEAHGTLVLSIEQPFVARGVIEVASPAASTATANRPAGATVAALRPVASRLRRTVTENFGFHEPMYFLYGPDEPVAKFQLSFRYRLAGRRESPVESDPAARGLYLAYTQRSLWNIKEPSSPFYDTSYMPELMFESLAPDRPGQQGLVSFIGYQAGYRHESNGRDGIDSRSTNIVYLRTGLLIGRRDGWRALVVPRVFAYVGESSDNRDLAKYRGHGELLLSIGRDDGLQVNLTGMVGRDWDKGSVQVDVTHPIKIPAVNFDTYFQIQYFDGYGESLRDYNRKSSTWRAGLGLVR